MPDQPSTAAVRLVPITDVNDRLESLRVEALDQQQAIYRGEGVPAARSLRFIDRVIWLALVVQGTASMDTVADVIEMLDEEKRW